ncbi:MAG TPA: hypothetical protein VEG38_22585 [Acidimicrobiia bacterium]|nr:hypothetical protein [Acidimicrobiia bacterium]
MTVQRGWARRLSPRMLLVAVTSVVMVLSALAVAQTDIGSPTPVSVATLAGGESPLPAGETLPGEDLAALDAAAPEAAPNTEQSTTTTAAESTTTTARAFGAATAAAARTPAHPPCNIPDRPDAPTATAGATAAAGPIRPACPRPCARSDSPTTNGAAELARPACPPPPCGPTTDPGAGKTEPAPGKIEPAPPGRVDPVQPVKPAAAQPSKANAAQPVSSAAQETTPCPPPCYGYDTGNGAAGCPQPCPAYATADGRPAPCPQPCPAYATADGKPAPCPPPCYSTQTGGAEPSCPPPPCAYPTEPDGGIGNTRPAILIYCPPPCSTTPEADASCPPPPCYTAKPAPASATTAGGASPLAPSQSCPPPCYEANPAPASTTAGGSDPAPPSRPCPPPPCPSAAATDQSCTPPCSYPGGDGSGAGGFAPCADSSGVAGRIGAGPTCPVERSDQACADKPVETALRLLRQDSSVAATATSRADGTFRMAAEPGSYKLVADWPSRVGGCIPVEVSVDRGRFTYAEVRCDTGIR